MQYLIVVLITTVMYCSNPVTESLPGQVFNIHSQTSPGPQRDSDIEYMQNGSPKKIIKKINILLETFDFSLWKPETW